MILRDSAGIPAVVAQLQPAMETFSINSSVHQFLPSGEKRHAVPGALTSLVGDFSPGWLQWCSAYNRTPCYRSKGPTCCGLDLDSCHGISWKLIRCNPNIQ